MVPELKPKNHSLSHRDELHEIIGKHPVEDCYIRAFPADDVNRVLDNMESYISQLESKVASLERVLAKKIAQPIDNN